MAEQWQRKNDKITAKKKITLAFRAFGVGLGRGETTSRLQWPKKSRRRLALRNCEKKKRIFTPSFVILVSTTTNRMRSSCITLSKDQQGLAASRLCGTT